MSRPMRTVSFKLPPDLDDRLSRLAEARRTSRSALVREALSSLPPEDGRSVTALAGDLIGSLDGPEDLSTNERHLDGYGE